MKRQWASGDINVEQDVLDKIKEMLASAVISYVCLRTYKAEAEYGASVIYVLHEGLCDREWMG